MTRTKGMNLDIGIVCDASVPHLDFETLRDRVTEALQAAVPGITLDVSRFPADRVNVSIRRDALDAQETWDLTHALARYACGVPEKSGEDLVWECPGDAQEFAEEIAYLVWARLGRFVEIRAGVFTDCEAECRGCHTGHRGWQSHWFDRHDYRSFRDKHGVPTVSSVR